METQRLLEARNGQILVKPKSRPRYSKQRRILIVGDGNFSFASCLATAFGVAPYLVATSLDSRVNPVGKGMGEFGAGVLLQKYGKEADLNTLNLYQRGALVFHSFDACKMATQQKYLLCGFQMPYFDCIIFNFPHAGFLGPESDPRVITKHKELVRLFFANARQMLLPGGQVHVSHKLGHPYDEWKLEEQARVSGLRLVDCVRFHRKHYPGYQNRRGDGSRAGESFKLGQAATYIFAARTEESPASTWNVGEHVVMIGSTRLAHLKSLQEKADEVNRLEKLRLGKMKMKTLEYNLMKTCTEIPESTLPSFGPETKLEDRDLVSQNINWWGIFSIFFIVLYIYVILGL